MNDDMRLFVTSEDAKMHLALLLHVAKADGVLADKERAFIQNTISIYSSLLGSATPDAIFNEIERIPFHSISDWKSSLKNHPVQSRNLIKDLITLGYVDMDFSAQEKSIVDDVAAASGISRDVVEKIADAVRMIMEATRDLTQLIFVKSDKTV